MSASDPTREGPPSGTPAHRSGSPPSSGSANDGGLVNFDDSAAKRTAEEEVYEPPPSAAVAALMTPPATPARSATPRDGLPAVPRMSEIRRSGPPSGGRSSWVVVLGIVAGLGLVVTGVVIVGGVAGWSWYRASQDAPPAPVEVVAPADPTPPEEVGGIPLENRLRKGTPAPGPKRPDAP